MFAHNDVMFCHFYMSVKQTEMCLSFFQYKTAMPLGSVVMWFHL